jgi:DNA-directed RNA polymerase specialized sigma24 family protein
VNGNDQPRSLLNVQASHEIAGNPIVGDRQPIDQSASFSAFVDETRIGLIRALAAHHPPQLASDVAADAFAWGWANWERLQTFSNPAGYLYRLADNRAKRTRQRDDCYPSFPTASALRFCWCMDMDIRTEKRPA